jgi:hypothetical protein
LGDFSELKSKCCCPDKKWLILMSGAGRGKRSFQVRALENAKVKPTKEKKQ